MSREVLQPPFENSGIRFFDMEEIWKDYPEFEGRYKVSNLGRVKSLNYHRERREHILNPIIDIGGYEIVKLCKEGKVYPRRVHLMVAMVYVPNPGNKPEVNHIDGNKLNCSLENLEWVTRRENDRHARATGLHTSDGDKRIGQFKNGVLIRIYKSVSEAARINMYNRTMISGCVNHRQNKGRKPIEKYKGYEWRQI